MTLERFSSLVNRVISSAIDRSSEVLIGLIASPPYEMPAGFNEDLADAQGSMWVVDVDIGASDQQPLKAVPIATNNRDIFYADQGKAVQLRRMVNGKWAVVGLSKLALDVTEITYMSFADDIAVVTRTETPSVRRRALTLEEIGTLAPLGEIPIGSWGIFDIDGNFQRLVETW